jgi:hypothetical protein
MIQAVTAYKTMVYAGKESNRTGDSGSDFL